MEVIEIAKRFCGPSTSGNGGYTCGRLAAAIDGDAEVTLRLPPPLDTPMTLERDADGVRLMHGDDCVAEAKPATLELELPSPPSPDQARTAEAAYRGHQGHAFPECFVCGPSRGEGDGLRIFTGPLPGTDRVAATWVPHASLGDADGNVRPEFLWASIDCAGSWAPEPRPAGPIVLGRFTASLRGAIACGDTAIVIGWPIAAEGRKYQVGSAVFAADGELLACARATWIELRAAPA